MLPLVAYLFFASGVNNFAKLPVLKENVLSISDYSKVDLNKKISILFFLGSNIEDRQGDALNMNQKIYKRFYDFEDFQFVVICPLESEQHADDLKNKLEIFRGLIKFKSNVQKIWGVLIFLSIVTAIEVVLGIVKPEALMAQFLSMKLINWIFVILTLVKAYYITWDFMHMRDEKFGLQVSVVITLIFLIGYAAFIFLVEGNYIYDIMYLSLIHI